jgi:hypothetical protein
VKRPFAIYVGRIDENKGCAELFTFFERYAVMYPHGLDLVLVGSPVLEIPKHPRIRHLGFLPDDDKFDAVAAADVLIMPSRFESLSMVALEAWAMGKPVLANAKCDVLQGQCLRSNAGLFYANYPEFAETLRAIDTTPSLQAALGRNGRAFFERHYAWPVIIQKYVDMLSQLSREKPPRAMEPLPGWLTRRRRNLPPADAVVSQLPKGPYRERPQPKVSAVSHQSSAGARSTVTASQSPAPPSAPSQRRFERPRRPEPARAEGATPKAGGDGKRTEGGRPPDSAQGRPKGDGDRHDQHRRHHRRGRRPGGPRQR